MCHCPRLHLDWRRTGVQRRLRYDAMFGRASSSMWPCVSACGRSSTKPIRPSGPLRYAAGAWTSIANRALPPHGSSGPRLFVTCRPRGQQLTPKPGGELLNLRSAENDLAIAQRSNSDVRPTAPPVPEDQLRHRLIEVFQERGLLRISDIGDGLGGDIEDNDLARESCADMCRGNGPRACDRESPEKGQEGRVEG